MSDDSNRNDDASPDAAEDGGPENFFIDILTGNKETESPKKLLVQKVLRQLIESYGFDRADIEVDYRHRIKGGKPASIDIVYDCHDFYKRPEDVVAFIETLLSRQSASEINGALVFPERSSRDAEAVLLLEENVGTLNDRPISRFHICNGWRYRYWKCRGYLAACVAIARRHGVYVHGRYAPARDIADVASGKVLLGWKGEGLLGFGHGRWEAEDLALKPAVFVRGVDPE